MHDFGTQESNHKKEAYMRLKCFFYILCVTLLLTGCSPLSGQSKETQVSTWSNSGYVTIGGTLTVQKGDSELILRDNMDALTADGLYYATWTAGDAKDYENSDGETVDLYDAQLYLLLGQSQEAAEAERNRDKWLDAARTNYEILDEEQISCNGQAYTLLTYNCVSKDNPYARGVSAFGVHDENAVCAELTCQENFDEDLRSILIDFLNNCTYERKD